MGFLGAHRVLAGVKEGGLAPALAGWSGPVDRRGADSAEALRVVAGPCMTIAS